MIAQTNSHHALACQWMCGWSLLDKCLDQLERNTQTVQWLTVEDVTKAAPSSVGLVFDSVWLLREFEQHALCTSGASVSCTYCGTGKDVCVHACMAVCSCLRGASRLLTPIAVRGLDPGCGPGYWECVNS